MEHVFKLLDFNLYNKKEEDAEEEEQHFMIQVFGINQKGESCSIIVKNFKPFFYIKVDDDWSTRTKDLFLQYIKREIGPYYAKSIHDCKIIKRKKLYGFDDGKEYKFIVIQFNNMQCFNKVKNLWYQKEETTFVATSEYKNPKLLENGFLFQKTNTYIYESNIPPLLRFFHIHEISPSGWIALPKKQTIEIKLNKKTTCDYEFMVDQKWMMPLNDKELQVPYKICSFDIEASSSHGDFPIPIKTYKKLATNIMEYYEKEKMDTMSAENIQNITKQILLKAFGYETQLSLDTIDLVYPKQRAILENIEKMNEKINLWLNTPIDKINKSEDYANQLSIESLFEAMGKTSTKNLEEEEDGEEDLYASIYSKKEKPLILPKKITILQILSDKKLLREFKVEKINETLNSVFPRLEGDKVTFIGSTFLKFGEKEPYLNNCIVLNTCDSIPIPNSEIETYSTEKEVLLAWRNLIEKENPDIIIGYNIFGFDYQFMFCRAKENNCVEDFLKLSRNKNEICGNKVKDSHEYKLEESTIRIASGQHDLNYIKMNGRVQIDLYNYFRREESLSSYKLDYVAGHFIGDFIKAIDEVEYFKTLIKSYNITGLTNGSFIHIQEIGHTTEYYQNGQKFQVVDVNKEKKEFTIIGKINPDQTKKIRWCLAKDDVTPKDIFIMTNGSSQDRSTIAKYCIQDCNLVHYLMDKVDILTGFIEMAKICSVPISFLILRGQGIKLTSYVAKKCREKRTLMPVLDKKEDDSGFEGAIVLDPKCDLYLDNPVACVDYASLYPSSMMSENLSHDSKVWTKEYNLEGALIVETGETDEKGKFIYDNLPNYEYVNITYDTYKYVRKTISSTAEKIKSGYKICRFALFPDGKRAIMPSILEELLLARKTTKKLIPLQTDEFMKNVLDKRQLGYKVTANSLYGQCGARTSTFYDKDIAASTTATGRLLLIYAKKIIEETYGNRICETKNHGPVLTKAEYIYGDSVANYTPIYIRINKTEYDICTIEELGIKYGNNIWLKKQDKEFCELFMIDTWTDNGWTKLKRIIRHTLAPHKKMFRVQTQHSVVDVTDDHSLLLANGTEISPKDLKNGTELLHSVNIPLMQVPKNFISGLKNSDLYLIKSFVYTDGPNGNNADYLTIIKSTQLEAAYIYWFCKSLLLNVKIEHENTYKMIISRTKDNLLMERAAIEKNKNKVVNIKQIQYTGYVYDLTTENHHFAAGVGYMIVHNTDSVFFTFNLETLDGDLIRGKKALEITIELAQEAGHLATSFLKKPHDLEYEKTFMPFCLLSKKRYVGILYEHDPEKGKRKEMGIVLKRRDNAPIVKDIYGGILDILMKEQDIKKAIEFLKSCLKNIVEEKYPIDKLIITKSLRSGYKNPQQIAHKVLSDRITVREPGNKPSSGDRIPYVFIHNSNKKALQGEKIETPTFIKENNLKIDYSHYITNQIMKPVQQLFALVLEKIWIMQNKPSKLTKFKREMESIRKNIEINKVEDKIESARNKEIKILLFDEFLRETNNSKNGNQTLVNFFK